MGRLRAAATIMTSKALRVSFQIFLFFAALMSVSGCKPFDYASSGLVITMESSKYIMVNAPAMSCRSATSTTPTLDITPLSMDLGKLSLSWTVPSDMSLTPTPPILKVIYVQITLRTQGLTNVDTPLQISGQDLNCIMRGTIDGSSSLSVSEGGDPTTTATATFPFAFELPVGGFTAKDTTLKSSFTGTANVLVYALIHQSGQQDRPVIGRTTFQFQFGAIQ